MMLTRLLQLHTSLWEPINAPDSYLSLYLSLMLFGGGLLYRGKTFHQWSVLHNVYNVGATLLAVLSLYYQDDTIMNERVVVLFSLGYFAVDLVDCIVRSDVQFLLHAVFCLTLGMAFFQTPVCLTPLRITSKSVFCEASTPLLHYAKQTQRPAAFGLFALVFTLCRILWIPHLFYQCTVVGQLSILRHPVPTFLLAMYGLNLYWYSKIIHILRRGGKPSNNNRKNKKE